jgi:hypothetical protein
MEKLEIWRITNKQFREIMQKLEMIWKSIDCINNFIQASTLVDLYLKLEDTDFLDEKKAKEFEKMIHARIDEIIVG